MTKTEMIIAGSIVVGLAGLLFGAWGAVLLFFGIAIYLLATTRNQMSTDPAYMAIVALFGRPTMQLIREPRTVFVYEGFPLYESLIPVPKGNLTNYDFRFEHVECGMENLDDNADIGDDFKVGGTVTVEISHITHVIPEPVPALNFVNNKREEGTKKTERQRLENFVRNHAKHRKWEKFVGEKEKFAGTLDGEHVMLLEGLGLDPGEFKVENITPEGDLGKDAAGAAREDLQRRNETLDNETVQKNAESLVAASKNAGDNPPLTLERAISIVQTNRGSAKRVIITSEGDVGKVPPAVITGALNEGDKHERHNHNHDDGNHDGHH
jgi:hypothetical protein